MAARRPRVINTGMVGNAEVSVDVANREVAVTLNVFNVPTATTAGHIHVGPAGISGPVVLNFPPRSSVALVILR